MKKLIISLAAILALSSCGIYSKYKPITEIPDGLYGHGGTDTPVLILRRCPRHDQLHREDDRYIPRVLHGRATNVDRRILEPKQGKPSPRTIVLILFHTG